MKTLGKLKWSVSILSVGLILLGALIFLMFDPFHLRAPTDNSLIQRFHQNKSAFVSLHQMMVDDAVSYVSPTEFDSRLSGRRQREYAELLALIGNPTLLSEGNTTKYRYAGGGLLAIGPGWQKGIQFECFRDVESLASLDSPRALKAGEINQRTIDGNWCLIFEIFD